MPVALASAPAMLVGAFGARSQPRVHLLYFLLDEFLVMEGACQRGDTLAAGEQMHRELVGIRRAAEQRELPAQPGPEQRKELVRLALRGMIELRKLTAQRSEIGRAHV